MHSDEIMKLIQLELTKLNENELKFDNPLLKWTRKDLENPALSLFRFMRNPDYVYFTCKHVLNVRLLPYQQVILQEMWKSTFPMLIASRGAGKSFLLGIYAILRALFMPGRKVVITGSGFRQAKTIMSYIETRWYNSPILRSIVSENSQSGPHHDADRWVMRLGDSTISALPLGDGCLHASTMITAEDKFCQIVDKPKMVWGNGEFRESDEHYHNGVCPTKRIKTRKGYVFEGTYNHRMKVVREGKICWCRADEMRKHDYILIDRSWRWHQGNEQISDVEAYALGLMIGDGSYCDSNCYKVGFATCDSDDFISPLREGTGLWFSQNGDKVHWNAYGVDNITRWLERWEMEPTYTIDKTLPLPILRANRERMSACLRGLFDTDGHVQVSSAKGGTSIAIGLTNTSLKLMRQVHYILLHYGIVSYLSERDRDDNWNTVYELLITGPDVRKFYNHIGFRLRRKNNILATALSCKVRENAIVDCIPDIKEDMVNISRSHRTKRGQSNSATTATSASKLKKRHAITHNLAKKFLSIYGHIEDERIDKIRELCNSDIYYDYIVSIDDDESDTYDIHVPNIHEYCANGFFSHNTKIRGERAHDIIADEFASIPRETFETVVAGFGVVELEPYEKVQRQAEIAVMKKLGIWTSEMEEESRKARIGNQSIISGTAYYQFNHFAEYWKRWKGIIESKGDPEILSQVLGKPANEIDLDWRDYSIIRLPVGILPAGYMDERHVARSRATVHSGVFLNEFGAVFSADTNGFFKRSLVESCVTNEPIQVGEELIQFKAVVRGNPNGKYVYGIDPASENDKTSIVILELHETHHRIVYCWTTNKAEHMKRVQSGLNVEKDFYGFCARKVRELMTVFPCEHIAMDSQGGGIGIREALHDPDKMRDGEKPIWEIKGYHPFSDGKEKPTDSYPGLHILELCNFARAEYTAEANHGLRKDFEDKVCLFPMSIDTATLAIEWESDQISGRVYDTYEDCFREIEELKEELATIVHTQTPGSNRDRWDTPEIKIAGSRKGRLRKDRYSALVMANYAARRMSRKPEEIKYEGYGGFAGQIKTPGRDNRAYLSGPDWFINPANEAKSGFGTIVRRGVK